MNNRFEDPPSTFDVAYVVTTHGRDVFANMALLSVLSLKLTNPGARVTLLCDEKSASALQAEKHRLLEVCEQIIPISTPDGDDTLKNRWIKTQMNRYMKCDFIYLDADTLVRGPLSEMFNFNGDVAGVANHNAATVMHQVWEEDVRFLLHIGCARPFDQYLNGGVLVFKQSQVTDSFFQIWHHFWSEGYYVTARPRDQPSLNVALRELGGSKAVLSGDFNRQVSVSRERHAEAQIWHFYSNLLGGTCLARLLGLVSSSSTAQLRLMLEEALSQNTPWLNGATLPSPQIGSSGSSGIFSMELFEATFRAHLKREEALVTARDLASGGQKAEALKILALALQSDLATRTWPVILEGMETISDAIESLDPKQAMLIRHKLIELKKSAGLPG